MTLDKQVWLATIRSDPDNDTLRMVYADWLDENGEWDRAEFIRVQIELAKMTPPKKIRADYVIQDLVSNLTINCTNADAMQLKKGEIFDVEEITSRVSARQLKDYELLGQSGNELCFKKSSPWSERDRYDELLRIQNRILVRKDDNGVVPFYRFAYTHGFDEDGNPVGPNGRGGMTVYPAYDDQFPYVEITPRIRQTFRRGFVEEIECYFDVWIQCGKEIVKEHPIRTLSIRDKNPAMCMSGQYRWFWATEDDRLSWASYRESPEAILSSQTYTGCRIPKYIIGEMQFFETESEADRFLSKVLIEWAKS